jgi:hypothetical protein
MKWLNIYFFEEDCYIILPDFLVALIDDTRFEIIGYLQDEALFLDFTPPVD